MEIIAGIINKRNHKLNGNRDIPIKNNNERNEKSIIAFVLIHVLYFGFSELIKIYV